MVNGYELANFVLFAKTPGKLIERLKKEVIYIEAAGGLVRNQQGQYLFIFRHGKWDLPKGKLEAGETPAEGGIREVEEECGITIATLGTPLEPTRSEEHTSELQSLMRHSYAVFCLKKKKCNN